MVSFSVCRVSIPLIQSSRERLPGRCKRYLGEVSVNIPVSKKRGRRGGGGNFCGSSSWWRGDLFPILCSPAFYRDWPTRVPQEMGDPDATVRTTATKFAPCTYRRPISLLSTRVCNERRFACEKKNEVSSANCGDTLGSRMEDSRYFRGDTRMAEISLGYEWWACVGLRFVDSMRHRMRRVHLDFLLFQS